MSAVVQPSRRVKVMGVDLGSRRIGVAVSDSSGIMAFPVEFVARSGDTAADNAALAALVAELEVGTVVVGLPLSLDGSRQKAATSALAEADELVALLEPFGVDVVSFDERFTTTSAHRQLAQSGRSARDRRQRVDSAAAVVLLQAYLEAR